jgi:hypothetical protein
MDSAYRVIENGWCVFAMVKVAGDDRLLVAEAAGER